MNNKQREEMIVNAIKHITNAYHFSLIKGVWCHITEKDKNYTSPLGCVVFEANEKDKKFIKRFMCEEIEPEAFDQMSADTLKTTHEWIVDFDLGFDGVIPPEGIINKTSYALGKKMAKLINPISFHTIAGKGEENICMCGDCYDTNNEEELEEEHDEYCGCSECSPDDHDEYCDCEECHAYCGDCDICGYEDEE